MKREIWCNPVDPPRDTQSLETLGVLLVGVGPGMLPNLDSAQDGPQTTTQPQCPQCRRGEPLMDREGVIAYHTPRPIRAHTKRPKTLVSTRTAD